MSEMKPCDAPCPKCGSPDINRRFRAKGSDFKAEAYGRAGTKYAHASTWHAVVQRDHIHNVCRCCQFKWQSLPLAKPRTETGASQ